MYKMIFFLHKMIIFCKEELANSGPEAPHISLYGAPESSTLTI